jgi:hypothetical protein
MAYMNQERKQARMPEIKRVLKKYGVKGSVSVRNHSTLTVTVTEGSLDILGNFFALYRNYKRKIVGFCKRKWVFFCVCWTYPFCCE